MTLRRTLPGLLGVVLVCGSAVAGPPGRPLSEGRELDPVVRDFHLDPPAVPETGAPSGTEKPGDFFGHSILAALGEVFQNHFAIPLGPIRSGGGR